MEKYKQEFIEFMVKSNVLLFGDFTTKSGRKSPYFINTGNYKTAEQVNSLGRYYAECIMSSGIEADVIFGPAYKGIPLAITTCISLLRDYGKNLDYCFNRKEAKEHGEGGSVIGHKLSQGDEVVVIDDVITAGTALREVIPSLEGNVAALVVSVDRMEKGRKFNAINEIECDFGIRTFSIVNIKEIISHLHNRPIDGKVHVDDDIKGALDEYLKRYTA